jgi:hypothetical protein
MAGTRTRTEGLVGLVCESAEISGSDVFNSVEGIDVRSIQDRATCYVRDVDQTYRWFQDSVAAPAPPNVILPASQTVAEPGRWVLQSGGGGGGSVNSVIGSGGITTTNPAGPIVTVNGMNLLARNGSNGGMTADLDMGGNDVQNAVSVSSAAGLALTGAAGLTASATTGNVIIGATVGNILVSTATGGIDILSKGPLVLRGSGGTSFTWPGPDGTAGQALVTDGSGNLSFATVGGTATLQSAYNAGPSIITSGGVGTLLVDTSSGTVMRVDAGSTQNDNLVLNNNSANGSALNILEGTLNFTPTNVGSVNIDLTAGAFGGLLKLWGKQTTIKGTTSLVIDAGAPLNWPTADGTAGQALVTDGAGNLSFATVSGSTPASPDRSIQFNNGGAFDGSSNLLFNSSATTRLINMKSPVAAPGTSSVGLRFEPNGSATEAGSVVYNEGDGSVFLTSQVDAGVLASTGDATLTASSGNADVEGLGASVKSTSGNVTLQAVGGALDGSGSGINFLSSANATFETTAGSLALTGFSALFFGVGSNTWQWPSAFGTAGQVLTDDGAGNLYWSTPSGGIPTATVQNITAAGPTAITNTMNTHARVNFAGAAAVTLPAGAVGKQITVKDVSNAAATNNITVSAGGALIDGVASYTIATNYGSATFICVSTGPDVWDVV